MPSERPVHDPQTGSISLIMTDPGVQRMPEWLHRQPFSLRFLTLLLFMVEAVQDEFGEEIKKNFEDGLREACRKLPSLEGKAN
jgi:hypothetical protein